MSLKGYIGTASFFFALESACQKLAGGPGVAGLINYVAVCVCVCVCVGM